MKSKTAKLFIDDALQDASCLVDADGVGMNVITKRDAIRAVELAEQEIEEKLTRWNDPKQELPDDFKPVEVKYSRAGHISHAVAYVRDHEDYNVKIWMVDCTKHIIDPYKVIGWREIF